MQSAIRWLFHSRHGKYSIMRPSASFSVRGVPRGKQVTSTMHLQSFKVEYVIVLPFVEAPFRTVEMGDANSMKQL